MPETCPHDLLRLQEIDNKDDRREIYHALSKIELADRIAFLEWCRDKVNNAILAHDPPHTLVVITSATGELMETYLDLMAMHVNWDLQLGVVLRELERRAEKARKIWVP